MDTKTIGNKLKYYRKQNGLTQQALADEFNIKQDDISRYENDKQDLNLSILRLYCRRFGVSADYLLGLTDTPTNDKDVRAICDYTGLSESAVKTLNRLSDPLDHIFSGVPSEFTPIIDYLINDIGLKFNKDANGVITDTCRYKHDSVINALAKYLYIHPDDDQSVYVTTNGKIFLDREKAFEENRGKTDINQVFIENSADLIRSTYYNNLIRAITKAKENYRGDTDGNNQKTQ